MQPSHTVVVGAGIVGVSTAYFLARRGHAVTVLSDGDASVSASAGNAGIIALGHPPLPRPGLVRQSLAWMLDPASPLYVPVRFDPALWRWMWQFARACEPLRFRRSTEVLARLGRAAGACFESILREEAFDCCYGRRGWLELYTTETAREHGRRDADLLREHGFRIDDLDRDEVRTREPALGEAVIGAAHHAESASLHPGRFLQQMTARAQALGAALRPAARVTRLLRDNGAVTGVLTAAGERLDADTVVLAAGTWTTGLARTAGVRVPMQPGKGYHVNLPMIDPPLRTALVLAERHIAATPMGAILRLAGTVELSGLNLRLHPRRVAMLTEGAARYLPAAARAEPSAGWCGLRPCTADGLPVIGWAPSVGGLFIATGHAKMGLCLGPVTGRLASECILDGEPSMDLSEMSPARFA